jgi:hypothetical protein
MNKLSLVLALFMVACSSKKAPTYSYTPPPPQQQVYVAPPPVVTVPTVSTVPVIQPKERTLIKGKEFLVSELTAKMGKIDDIGLVFVRHSDGSIVLAQSAAWKYGLAGSASGSLNPYLGSGTNLVIFALYNHKGKKVLFQEVLNSWSYEFSLFADSTAIFMNSDKGKQLANGVMSWLVFSVTSSGNRFIVSRASESELSRLKPAFKRINADFIKHSDFENVADISSAIAVGIRTATN